MAYDDKRSYIQITQAAQNAISTASNHVNTSTLNGAVIPIIEATFLCSIAAICTASSGTQIPTGMKWVLFQTNTTSLAQLAIGTETLNQLSSATFNPPVAIPANTWLNLRAVGTGTASETNTASAHNWILGVSPQFV